MAGFLSRLTSAFRSEKKDAVAPPVNTVASPLFSAFFSNTEITPYMAWQLYRNVAPLAKVVDLIADEVSRLQPMVRINGQVVEDHPILAFLKRPGFNRTRQRLIKELAVQYLVTGTAYPVAYGNTSVRDLPIAIDVMKTHFVTPMVGHDMWPMTYYYAEGTRSQQFERDQTNPRDYRWLHTEPQSGLAFAEIIPIYDMDGDRRGVGLPRLNAIKYDVELRLKGIQHNSSVLDKGARLSGVLSFKGELNEEQRADIQSMMAKSMGASGAGSVLVTAGGENDFTPMSQTAKDMDFAKLIEIVEDAIVSRYNVPITLFRTSAQTNNNYETAWKFFYNLAMLPTFEVIYSGLAQIFSERIGAEVEIVHDALTNPVLSTQALEKALKLYDHHLVSRNEARDIVGYEPVLGGDTIYGSLSDVAQAEDYFTNHGINDPEADNSQQAYHQARPEADPVNQAAASAAAIAAAAPEKDDGSKPGKDKPKKPDKKPDAAAKKSDDAFGVMLEFADFVKKSASGADPPGSASVKDSKGKKKVA